MPHRYVDRLRAFACAVLASSSVSAFAAEVGPVFIANNYREGSQQLAFATSGGNGDTALVWRDLARGGYYFVQRYDGNGVALQSDEWFLGNHVSGFALDRWGNYTVMTTEPEGDGYNVFLIVYARNGSVLIPRFKVNTSLFVQGWGGAMLASNGAGQITVVWSDRTLSQGVATWTPYARSYSASGAPVGGVVAVSPAMQVMVPQGVAMDAAGNYAVCWSGNPVGGDSNVWFRRMSPTGTALSATIMVNPLAAGQQANCSVAMTPSGNSVVSWQTLDGSSSLGLSGQRFNASGGRVGGEFPISQTGSGPIQVIAKIGMTDNGSFFTTWYRDLRSTLPASIPAVMMRQFSADATPLTGEVQVNLPTSVIPGGTVPAVDPAGNAIFPWTADGDVLARRWAIDNQVATTSLSNAVPAMGLAGATGSWRYFKIVVPAGRPSMTIRLSGPGTGDADLFGRVGTVPTLSVKDVSTAANGNVDTIVLNSPQPGVWYFGMYGYTAFTGVNLTVTY
jgi:hypothetical protein